MNLRRTCAYAAKNILTPMVAPITGRLPIRVLSPMLKHFGRIEDRAFFFGATTHFMLWNPDVFLKEAPAAFNPIKDELDYWLAQAKRDK